MKVELGQNLSAEQAIKLAIFEAKKGQGFVAPNPVVGAVILDQQGRLISFGHHARCGGDHAEVAALKKIPAKTRTEVLKGAQVFVTLEPCAHQGRTPSCAQELARWPIAKVVYGLEDPNPRVSGRGAEILRQAGVLCEPSEVLQEELEDLAEIFLTNMRQQTCFVALKVATSLDGHLAMRDGKSQWISNEKARHSVQYLRGVYDAVLVGSGTFLVDQPRLNSRHPRFMQKTNHLVVLDPSGDTLPHFIESPAAQVRPLQQITLVISRQQKEKWSGSQLGQRDQQLKELQERGVTLLFFDESSRGGQSSVDLAWLKKELFGMGLTSILVEGGAHTHSTFLQQGAADRIYQFIAPVFMGGSSAINWTQDLSIRDFDQRVKLSRVQFFRLGENALVTGRLFR